MHLILPIAGHGSRLRPLTLTTPKAFVPIVEQPILQRLIRYLHRALPCPIQQIGFVIGKNLAAEYRSALAKMAYEVGATPHFYVQEDPKGTAHAVACAKELLTGPVLIALGDMWLDGPLTLHGPGCLFTHRVDNPALFGIVSCTAADRIVACLEKPANPPSNRALIGLHYLENGVLLQEAISWVLQQPTAGEFGLTDAFTWLLQQGIPLIAQDINTWIDCGQPAGILQAEAAVLQHSGNYIAKTAILEEAVLIPPVYIGAHTQIKRAQIGPYVSLGAHSQVMDAEVAHAALQPHSCIQGTRLEQAWVGAHATLAAPAIQPMTLVGDYSQVAFPTTKKR